MLLGNDSNLLNREYIKMVLCGVNVKEILPPLQRCRQDTYQHTLNFRSYKMKIFQYISNKMQRYTVNLYLETSLHVSAGKSTHHQEHTQLYLQHLVLVKP